MNFKQKICAGIVLYNPEIDLLEKNISAIENQVDCIYLYDNGSENTAQISEMLKSHSSIHYDYNSENKGIAYALNRILKFADSNGYEWFLSMDQDSVCSADMIEVYSKFANDCSNALITPFILNNDKYTLEEYQSLKLPDMEYIHPTYAITSACLSRVSALKEIGGFDETLFIDFVDFELNCLIDKAGYNIVRANNAYLIQQMGKAKTVPLFKFLFKLTHINFFRKFQVTPVYNDLRLYYFSRNSYIVYKRHKNVGMRANPLYILGVNCFYSVTYPLSRNRIKMWKSILKGFNDGKKIIQSLE